MTKEKCGQVNLSEISRGNKYPKAGFCPFVSNLQMLWLADFGFCLFVCISNRKFKAKYTSHLWIYLFVSCYLLCFRSFCRSFLALLTFNKCCGMFLEWKLLCRNFSSVNTVHYAAGIKLLFWLIFMYRVVYYEKCLKLMLFIV